MRKTFFKYSIVFVLLAFSAGGLMGVSQYVQKIERDIAVYDRAIELEQEKIRVLKAEWAYLNNPIRLEALATGAFGLEATDVKAVVSNSDLIPEYDLSVDSKLLSTSIPISYGHKQGGLR